MELRHLRYFVAVAEAQSFVAAAARLRVAQPALSKQIRDLEAELGTALFERGPRGVQLTTAGRAFLLEARRTLEGASRAMDAARGAAAGRTASLRFAHGELAAYGPAIENLLAKFREAHSCVQVEDVVGTDAETFQALRDRRVDVGAVFIMEWPVPGFDAHRLIDTRVTGVLVSRSSALAAQPSLRLADLRTMSWLNTAPRRWPGFQRKLETALHARGLVPERQLERARQSPVMNVQIATGDAWALVSKEIAAPYREASMGIVYRPFEDPPIPCWLALVWLPPATAQVAGLIDAATAIGLRVP